jgi:hypothetical protein
VTVDCANSRQIAPNNRDHHPTRLESVLLSAKSKYSSSMDSLNSNKVLVKFSIRRTNLLHRLRKSVDYFVGDRAGYCSDCSWRSQYFFRNHSLQEYQMLAKFQYSLSASAGISQFWRQCRFYCRGAATPHFYWRYWILIATTIRSQTTFLH